MGGQLAPIKVSMSRIFPLGTEEIVGGAVEARDFTLVVVKI